MQWICGAFDFLPNIAGELAFGGAGLSAWVLNQKISPGCREYTRAL